MPNRYHYDPNQPRVPAAERDGGRWTSEDYERRPISEPVRYTPATPMRRLLEVALGIYTWLSLHKGRDQQAIIVVRAREYHRHGSDGFDVEDVRLLTQEEVDSVCRRLRLVQIITDSSDNAAKPLKSFMSPSEYGTLVHTLIQRQINAMGDPNFRAEVSHIKGIEEAQDYGSKGSVRVDVLEKRDEATVCVYDIKTGRSGLSAARFAEIARSVFSAYGPVQRIIITEVRPTP